MKIYKSNEEVKKDIKDGYLIIEDDVHFDFENVIISANIKANNIDAYNIKANNIDANNIKAYNIDAYNIKANNIDANNIKAYNIDANDIDANDIKANNIKCAFCIAYNRFECVSVKGGRENSDNEIVFKEKKQIER
jgi:hypothetical protein